MSDFKAPPRTKTIQDNPSLRLTAPKVQGAERGPSLMLYVHPNDKNPSNTQGRIVVFTQTPENDPKKQKIEVKIELLDLQTIVKTIKRAAVATDKFEVAAVQTRVPKDYRNRAAGMRDDVKVVVGKSEQGVYISLISWNAEVPRIRFYFGSTEVFEFIQQEDKGMKFVEWSSIRAEAWCDIQSSLNVEMFRKHWKPWVPANQNSGQGGGYSGGQQNNYPAKANQNNDDDLDDVFG